MRLLGVLQDINTNDSYRYLNKGVSSYEEFISYIQGFWSSIVRSCNFAVYSRHYLGCGRWQKINGVF